MVPKVVWKNAKDSWGIQNPGNFWQPREPTLPYEYEHTFGEISKLTQARLIGLGSEIPRNFKPGPCRSTSAAYKLYGDNLDK